MPERVKAVKYIGVATTRRISESDWRAINVRDQDTVQWDERNGFTVLGKHLSNDACAYLREDDGFAVLMEDEEPEPRKPRPSPSTTA